MGLFNKKSKEDNKEAEMCPVLLHLNMRLMPIDRGELFEDPIDDMLHNHDMGEVTGGGTLLSKEKMPISSDVEFSIKRDRIEDFIGILKISNTISTGSYVEYDGKKEEIGTLEGLNLVLDGIGLNEEVYQNTNINDVIDEINNLLKDKGSYHSYYRGEKNINLYFYGNSFNEMKEIIEDYTKTSPLCENCIIEQI